jgi:hypothetical protein
MVLTRIDGVLIAPILNSAAPPGNSSARVKNSAVQREKFHCSAGSGIYA